MRANRANLVPMDETPIPAPRAVRPPGTTLLALAALLAAAAHGGCTATQQTQVRAAESAVAADAKSPAGQAILADVTSAALNAGLDAATGNDAAAVIAGIQGAASAMRDYEGLPSAPAAATIAHAAAVGAGQATVATVVAPILGTIIANATKSAQAQKAAVSVDAITEAAARGLDAVANAKL